MITVRVKGKYDNAISWLKRIRRATKSGLLDKYGKEGVKALSAATPVRTGLTASSWSYDVGYGTDTVEIHWTNSNVQNGFNVAIGLQYGHGTGTGGYVVGTDYINPAIQPILDDLVQSLWEEIINL